MLTRLLTFRRHRCQSQDVIFTEWLQINTGECFRCVFFCGYRQYLTLFPAFYFHQPHRERRFPHVWRQYVYNQIGGPAGTGEQNGGKEGYRRPEPHTHEAPESSRLDDTCTAGDGFLFVSADCQGDGVARITGDVAGLLGMGGWQKSKPSVPRIPVEHLGENPGIILILLSSSCDTITGHYQMEMIGFILLGSQVYEYCYGHKFRCFK